MLIQFSVENYLSIRDRITISFLAGNDKAHPEHLIPCGKKDNCLKSTVIYGANASGKTSVLSAFCFMTDYVRTSHKKQLHIPTGRTPFKFDSGTLAEPSVFEVIFVVEGVRYVYGFSATDDRIVEECLYHYPNGRRAVIFERTNTDEYRFTVDMKLQNALNERNSPNKLYLSTAANWNYAVVKPAFTWFESCVCLLRRTPADAYGIHTDALRNDSWRAVIASMMRDADFGIDDLEYRSSEIEFGPIPTLPCAGDYDNIDAVHQVRGGEGTLDRYVLRMSEEASGTKRYFELIGSVRKVLKQGGLLVVDDMDAHLHPHLSRHIVSLFNSTEHNTNGAQLLFAAHNTDLLDLDIFRRDQIWFTEKDECSAATQLFSLFDFTVHKNTDVKYSYLAGRFGAIPCIKNWSV